MSFLLSNISASKEFEDFQGFFKIVKIANLNSFQAYAIDTDLYGFKATKKKVHLLIYPQLLIFTA